MIFILGFVSGVFFFLFWWGFCLFGWGGVLFLRGRRQAKPWNCRNKDFIESLKTESEICSVGAMQDWAWPPHTSCCRPCSPPDPAGCGRRSMKAARGQKRGERMAQLILQQDGWARRSPSRLLCQPCGDRWLRSKYRPPSECPQSCQPHVSASKTARNTSLICI